MVSELILTGEKEIRYKNQFVGPTYLGKIHNSMFRNKCVQFCFSVLLFYLNQKTIEHVYLWIAKLVYI